jgi:hypothetical protein
MVTYKRNQVDDALCRSNDVQGPKKSRLLARVKRLLDTDRTLPAKRGAYQKQRLAFLSEKPGPGNEAAFQEYEIFALDLALLLAAQGVPQIDVVEILRTLRPALETEHREILEKPLSYYADISKAERSGEPVVSRHPAFLFVRQADKHANFVTKSGLTAELLHGGEKFWDRGKAATIVEFSLCAHVIRENLKVVEPRRKGRPA